MNILQAIGCFRGALRSSACRAALLLLLLCGQGLRAQDSLMSDPASLEALLRDTQHQYDSARQCFRDTTLNILVRRQADEIVARAIVVQDTLAWLRGLDYQQWYYRRTRQFDSIAVIARRRQALLASYGYDAARVFDIPDSETNRYLRVYNELYVLRDSTSSYDIRQVMAHPEWFSPNKTDSTRELTDYTGVYWVRVVLRNSTDRAGLHSFMPGGEQRTWDDIGVYYTHFSRGDSLIHIRTGSAVPDSLRSLPGTKNVFQIFLPPYARQVIYLRLASPNHETPPRNVDLEHFNYVDQLQRTSRARHINGVFQGIVLIQLVYFSLLYFSTRDRLYRFYSIYILGITIFVLTANYGDYLSSRYFNSEFAYLISIWLTAWGIVRFSEHYLQFRTVLPNWTRAMQTYMIVFTVLIAIEAALFLVMNWVVTLVDRTLAIALGGLIGILSVLLGIMVIGILIFMLIWGIQALQRRFEAARYYLIASVFLIFGMVIPVVLFFAGALMQNLGLFHPERLSMVMQGGVALQLSLFALAVGHQRNQLERDRREALEQNLSLQKRINAAADRFVPYEFLRILGRESILDVQLGDQAEKEVSVFFSDIRDYTTLSEQMTPQDNFNFLNAYLGRVGPVIKANRGFVNQYYGDGIMALYMSPQSARDSVEAAIEMQDKLRTYNRERIAKGRLPIRTGMGIHSGMLMLGVIGDGLRMDAGVVSDTVNTAARMEGLSKIYGARLLVSEAVFRRIDRPEDFAYRYLGRVQVKGKIEPLGIYELFEADDPQQMDLKQAVQALFARSIGAYTQRDFLGAITGFGEILALNPQDGAASYYLRRAQLYTVQGVDSNWSGVEEMKEK
ncbi:MAG: guanylate cyclase [Bacteroidia bacterium]